MTTQNNTTAAPAFDHEAAAGLSDEEYLAESVAPSAPEGGFDHKASAGLSDEEYLQDGTVPRAGQSAL